MKNDFKNLEGDMEMLLSKMDEITKSSETITSSLHVSKYFIIKQFIAYFYNEIFIIIPVFYIQADKDEISKLSETHKLLKRFQFVYTLPTTLNKLLQKGDYDKVNNAVFICFYICILLYQLIFLFLLYFVVYEYYLIQKHQFKFFIYFFN